MTRKRILVMGMLMSVGSMLSEAGFEVIDMSEVTEISMFPETTYPYEERVIHDYNALVKHRTLPIRPVERKPRCYLKV